MPGAGRYSMNILPFYPHMHKKQVGALSPFYKTGNQGLVKTLAQDHTTTIHTARTLT